MEPVNLSITRNGYVTLPASVRRALHLRVGDYLQVRVTEDSIVLTPRKLVDKNQEYYWSPEWQAAERETSEDVAARRMHEFKNVDDLLTSLDACILDFDDCLYPGISKVSVAIHAGQSVIFNPYHFSDCCHLPRLALAAAALLASRASQRLGGPTTNADLVRQYMRLLRPIPLPYFQAAAARIPSRLRPGAWDSLGWLAARWSVCIVSLALTDVLDAVDAELQARTGYGFAFKRGNDLAKWRSGQAFSPVLTAEDKRAHMAEALAQIKCRHPLVIGHDDEDMGMVELAREMGGVSIGFAPPARLAPRFDLVLPRPDWNSVRALMTQNLG